MNCGGPRRRVTAGPTVRREFVFPLHLHLIPSLLPKLPVTLPVNQDTKS